MSVIWTIPVDNHTCDSAAEHVRDLCLNLRRIIGVIANVHVVAHTEPGHEVRVNRGVRSVVEQGAGWNLARVSRSGVAVGLGLKSRRSAGVVTGLCR